ncbi:MAG: DMT family transporter [Zymomonas mobilis]|uniref:DMT family transporter n=1 Tax=Zymomonas mobilis TaxID=542 RepID=UPI0001B70568|nr:DMT family transporter [Zymomonas mobilis]ACV75694.1 protein of unknown function DUF6 transmembrane [Zymomonas mobilis subsp. mobilis NCIMB 11163]AHB10487.1 DMT(drug/metabolite transporter) superfamily permease [Zymomonas mobilis subsp. mobilis str. CP4 = NRRL B-14023]AHJ70793.1 Inner membrane protein ytfF [Zymomonas mobilis subsp. mobilis NRRL B-12526]AHJ72647.1 Inner membrane protein ytfF [Zymomonas mobilis subsp. mobilis str. CP4 = NRRL B-14023]TWE24562.1 drug/metabolite transporter (DMT
MVKEAHSSIISGVLFGAGAGVFWGLVFLAPELVPEFTSLQLVVGRFLAYGVISLILAIPKWSYLKKTVSLSEIRTLLCLALLGNTLYYTLLSNAVKLGGIALTSLILGFLPVTVSVIGSRDAEAIALRRLWPSLSFCIAGAFCIGAQALTTRSGHPVMGLFLALGALASWTAYAVGNSRALSRLPHLSVHDWNLLTGLATGFQAVLLIPIVVFTTRNAHPFNEWMQFSLVAIGVALAASIIGNALWNRMSRLLPLTMVGQMILFETLFALIYGFLWEKRWPHPLEIMAFIALVASVFSCVRSHHRHLSS